MNDEKLLATLKAVQVAGWWITGADAAGVEVGWPDCANAHHFPIGSDIPRLLQSFSSEGISSGRQACAILAARREVVGISAEDLSSLLGRPPAWIGRYEDPNAKRTPITQGFLEWAAALGFEVHLVPAPLPGTTLRWVSMTRGKLPARRRRYDIERQRDEKLRQRRDPLLAKHAWLIRQRELVDRQIALVEQQLRDLNKTHEHVGIAQTGSNRKAAMR